MLASLNARKRQPELMDQTGLDAGTHSAALSGLSRINWWSRSSAVLWRAIEAEVNTDRKKTWKVLDVASGAGDIACRLAQRAAASGNSLEILGCDISPTAVEQAQQRARPPMQPRWRGSKEVQPSPPLLRPARRQGKAGRNNPGWW